MTDIIPSDQLGGGEPFCVADAERMYSETEIIRRDALDTAISVTVVPIMRLSQRRTPLEPFAILGRAV